MTRGYALIALVFSVACRSSAPTAADRLALVEQRGTLIVSIDPNYAPQSVLKPNGARTPETRCDGDQVTAGELEGFDVDVAAEVARRLGVEVCFVTPEWDLITAGNWSGRWDVSVGSMTITTVRQTALDFTAPYYYTPAQLAVSTQSGISSLEQLAGRPVCAGTATTYEAWLSGDRAALGLPDESVFRAPLTGATVVSLPTDQECAQAIAAGRTDFAAYLTSRTVVTQNIQNGVPVVALGDPVFVENLAIALDKASNIPNAPLLARLNEIVTAMHQDGTLASLSTRWFGSDLTQAPTRAP